MSVKIIILIVCIFVLVKVYILYKRERTILLNHDKYLQYSDYEYHELMISDRHRMETYRKVLEENPSLIKGKKVLDVGCGTGVLSSFAIKGGASKVVGVDVNNVPKYQGTENVEFIIGKRIQNAIIPEKKFDVIVSEWMGCMLYEENYVDMFLYARDKYLKPGGAMLPDIGNIYVSGFRGKKYGIPGYKTNEYVDPKDIVTNDYLIHHVDFTTLKLRDSFKLSSDIVLKGEELIDGLIVWFDVEFTHRFCKENPVVLDTKRPTSWYHIVLRFEEPQKTTDIKNIKITRDIFYKVEVNGYKFREGGVNEDRIDHSLAAMKAYALNDERH